MSTIYTFVAENGTILKIRTRDNEPMSLYFSIKEFAQDNYPNPQVPPWQFNAAVKEYLDQQRTN